MHPFNERLKRPLGLRKQWVRSGNYTWDEHHDASALSPTVVAVWNTTRTCCRCAPTTPRV